jgi:hypothetical protein
LNLSKILIFVVGLSVFSHYSFSNAFAYIDPGTGSVIIQMIIGGLVGVGIAVKVFWFRIKSALSPGFKKNNSNEEI